MEFSVSKADLTAALGGIVSVLEPRPTMPILSAALLSAKGGKLSVTATNLETTIVGEVEADVVEAGAAAVSARRIAKIAQLVSGRVSFKLDKRVHISSRRHSYTLLSFPGRDFPSVDSPESVSFASVHALPLFGALSRVLMTASRDAVRPCLSAVYLDTAGDPRMVSTDGHRLTLTSVGDASIWEGLSRLGPPMLLSRDSAAAAMGLLRGAKGAALLGQRLSHVFLRRGASTLIARLRSEAFPPYEQVIPKAQERVCVVDAAEFGSAMKGALVTTEKASIVEMRFSSGELALASQCSDEGSSVVSLEAKFEGEPFCIGVNGNYILEMLRALAAKRIWIGCNGSLDPLTFKPCSDEGEPAKDRLIVIMPCRI